MELLRGFDYDLGKLIHAHESFTLGFGSEFRTVTELRPLLGKHVHFEKLEALLTTGMEYVLSRELSEVERMGEVKAMLVRVNHKSAQVGRLITKDVLHGFTIPIPVGIVELIPGAMVEPLGLAKQFTIGPDGERVIKYRLTQGLSFSSDKTVDPMSINSLESGHGLLSRDDLWVVPPAHTPPHSVPPNPQPDAADLHQQTQL